MRGAAVFLSISLIFFSFSGVRTEVDHFLIVEVQISGDISSNDFIKIYNPTDQDLDISGYRLKKRASTGSESSIRVFPKGSLIGAKNYFLWVNSKENFYLTLGANVWSTATLAKNNSIALFNQEEKIIDALAWGKSQKPLFEGSLFSENPEANQKLKRKQVEGIYQDTNNNAQDFYLDPPSLTIKELSVNKETKTETKPEKTPGEKPKEGEPKPELAALAKQISNKDSSNIFILLIAISLAVFSGIMILILKRKINPR